MQWIMCNRPLFVRTTHVKIYITQKFLDVHFWQLRVFCSMDPQRIIMNYTVSPSMDDLEVMAVGVLETLPEEILRFTEGMVVVVEDLVDEVTELELELDDAFEMLALYKSGKEISPGVQKKTAQSEDVLVLYRRAVLDMWCETGEDLSVLIRQIMIEELGRNFDFTDDEIEELVDRHYQGLL